MPKLSIIIPYKHGDELRQQAVRQLMDCIKVQTMLDFETIVIEDTGGRGMVSFPYKKDVNKILAITDPKFRLFNKSWCINVGVRNASSENVLILDADCIFGKDYFEEVLKFIGKRCWFFHGYDWIVLLPGRDNPILRVSRHRDICSTGGSWFTNKHFFFEKLGGANENYFGYGREDSDLWVRATHILEEIPEMHYPLTHCYHHWKVVDSNNLDYQKNCKIWHYTKAHTDEVIEKLKNANLGNLNQPTLI